MTADNLETCLLLLIFLPLAASIITGFSSKSMSKTLSHTLPISAVGLSLILSAYLWYNFCIVKVASHQFDLYTFAEFGDFKLKIGFLLDSLSTTMLVVVTFVSLMVHIYTMGYMEEDKGYTRFYCYIALFTFMMLMLVTANNFLQLFFGWEGVGLVSYLLIGFWFTKQSAIYANLKAFLVNRAGDFSFVLGLAALLTVFGSLDYSVIFAKLPEVIKSDPTISVFGITISYITLIAIALFVGSMSKSAQIPLHVWLPDSMEGPTPISALIHAATMVTAGVFLLARISPLLEYSQAALNFILLTGACTAFFMGLIGLVVTDIKRVVAYSTISQLGYMMAAAGVSAYSVSIFHLVTHAFFKALLFLGAGSCIVAMHHEQNMCKMGNLRKYLPITYACMLIGTLAITGVPPFAGFYSKDLIIIAVENSNLYCSQFATLLLKLGVFVTAFYSFRLLFLVFYGTEKMDIQTQNNLAEPSWRITLPLIGLAIPSIISGYLLINILANGWLDSSTFVLHPAGFKVDSALEMLLDSYKHLPFWLTIVGALSAWLIYLKCPSIGAILRLRLSWLHYILLNKYGLDYIFQQLIPNLTRAISWIFWKIVDALLLDKILVLGSAKGVAALAGIVRRLQTGYLYHYAFAMIVGLLLMILWLFSNMYAS